MKQFLRTIQLTVIIFLQSLLIHAQTLDTEWLNSTGGTEGELPAESALDNDGNVYVIGTFKGSIDIDPGLPVNTVTSAGNADAYIQKFNSNGDLIWGFSFGGVDNDYAAEITVDGSGNSYIVGYFMDFVDFDPGFGVTGLTASGQIDGFVMKVDIDGNFQWAKQIESGGNALINNVTVDNATNIIVSGFFDGTVDLDPSSLNDNHTSNGSLDMCIVKLDANGEYIWGKTIGGTGEDASNDLITDDLGNIYNIGPFQETVDFSGNGTAILTEFGTVYTDGYIQKMSSSGAFIWVKQISGRELLFTSSITLDDESNVIVLGSFSDTMTVDVGGTDSVLISGELAVRNVFVQKLDSAGTFQWIKQLTSDKNNRGNSIVSRLNDLYIAGSFNGTTDFDPTNGSQELTPVGVGGFSDGFYLKLNQNGELEWVSQFGGVENDHAESIEVNSNGKEIYVNGYYQDVAGFSSGTTTLQLTSNGESDAFVMKLNDVTGLFEYNQNSIRIYPNPSAGVVTVEMEANEIYEVQLLDSKGSLLTSIGNLSGIYEINIEEYETGIYFIRLLSEKGMVVQQVVKQ